MFCITAFVVLSILGIFSATNRALAREALDCVLRRVTFRPCNTGFDEKMKAKILGAVIMRSERLARFISKYFEVLAWIFFILIMGASVMAVRGLYLFYVTGSCNGLNQQAFCVFDPTGANNQVSAASAMCTDKPRTITDLTLKGVDLTGFPVLNPTDKKPIVFVGCYACDYTRKSYPMIMDLVKRYKSGLVFLHYPVKEKTDNLNRVGYCAYQQDQDKYWKMNDVFFSTDKANLDSEAFIQKTLTDLGYDSAAITTCANDPKTETVVKAQMDQIVKTNFYGTPTVFINDRVFVGPKPYRVYAIGLKGLLFWLQ
jgi:protein-disulfide isomerase